MPAYKKSKSKTTLIAIDFKTKSSLSVYLKRFLKYTN